MELRHLRYFVAAAEAENVSRAALKLHVSQPALSRQIRDLEEEVGFSFFERSAKSVRLTEAGRAFLSEAREVLQRAEQAVAVARAIAEGGRGELHVGYAPSPTVRILPAALRAFQAAMPNVQVRLHDLSTGEMLAGVREGRLHLAFVVRPLGAMIRGLHFSEVVRENACLAVPRGHSLARKRSVSLAQAGSRILVAFSRKDYPEYHEYLGRLFGPLKIKPRIAAEHDSAASLIAAIEAGVGVAIVPESLSCSVGPRLKVVAISPRPEPVVIGAMWSGNSLNPAAERFLNAAREAATKKT